MSNPLQIEKIYKGNGKDNDKTNLELPSLKLGVPCWKISEALSNSWLWLILFRRIKVTRLQIPNSLQIERYQRGFQDPMASSFHWSPEGGDLSISQKTLLKRPTKNVDFLCYFQKQNNNVPGVRHNRSSLPISQAVLVNTSGLSPSSTNQSSLQWTPVEGRVNYPPSIPWLVIPRLPNPQSWPGRD